MNVPKTIYKYRDWSCENHRKILNSNEIYLASPGTFNDPFDCKISTHYLSLDTPEKISSYIQKKQEESETELTENFIETLKYRLTNIQEYWDMFEAFELSTFDQNHGIISLSSRWNSILMWSHYANLHKGFCVGFNEEKMRTSGHFGFGGSVIYSDDFPIINPLEVDEKTPFLQLQYKAKDWKYEEEYRLNKLFFPEIPTDDDRKIILNEGIIEEVIVGMNSSREDTEEIVKICKRKNIKVYGASREPYKFGMVRYEL
ncbi:DUF2971 domain-containing protein [Flavobacterium sp. LB2P44]|uniref:DUF2971 domain-containing protein n=1 Tax=Flavobacterium sp. LB2P44 TaxID=3401713 RepID=UPI003AAE9689